jgi:hypothetical protein
MRQINGGTRAVILASCRDDRRLTEMPDVLGHGRRLEGLPTAGPPVQEVPQIKLRIMADQPLRQWGGLCEEQPVVCMERRILVHLFPHVERRKDIDGSEPGDPLRMIEREPIRHPATAVMAREQKPPVPQRGHELYHVVGHGAFGIVYVLRVWRWALTVAVPTEIGQHERESIRGVVV